MVYPTLFVNNTVNHIQVVRILGIRIMLYTRVQIEFVLFILDGNLHFPIMR